MNTHFEFSVHGQRNGNWVTLSHPIGSSMDLWNQQIAALSKEYRVLAYNLRGHGADSRTETQCSVADLANDVLQLWQQLGIAQSHFVGLSLGGCVGVALAHRAPKRVQSLVVANSRLEMDDATSTMWRQRAALVTEQGMESVVTMTIDRWFTPEFLAHQPETVEAVRQTLLNTPAHGFSAAANALANMHLQSLLPELQVSTLFISGQSDKAISTAMVEQYALQNPLFQFTAMPGPHILNLENPSGFNQAVISFISQQG